MRSFVTYSLLLIERTLLLLTEQLLALDSIQSWITFKDKMKVIEQGYVGWLLVSIVIDLLWSLLFTDEQELLHQLQISETILGNLLYWILVYTSVMMNLTDWWRHVFNILLGGGLWPQQWKMVVFKYSLSPFLCPLWRCSVYVCMYVYSAVLSIIMCCVTAFINTHLQKSPDLCSIDSTGTPVNQINRPLNVIRRRARDESAGSKLTRIECARTTQREMQN